MIQWPGIKQSNFFTVSEKKTFDTLCSKYKIAGPLTESILSRMRAGLDKLRLDGRGDLDELTIDKLQDVLLSASNFSGFLNSHFERSFDKILNYYKSGLTDAKDNLAQEINAGKYDYPKENIEQEVKDLSALSVFWLKDFKKIITDDIKSKYAKCLIAESMDRSADIIPLLKTFRLDNLNEGEDPWNFLDRAKTAIEGLEPYDTINQISDLRNNIGNASLNQFATLSNRIGGPKVGKMQGLGTLIGKMSAMRETPGNAMSIIKTDPILRFLPTSVALIETFEFIAFMVTVLELVSELKQKD